MEVWEFGKVEGPLKSLVAYVGNWRKYQSFIRESWERGRDLQLEEVVCESFARVLPHVSTSLVVERRYLYELRICASVKCSPVGTSNNMSTIALQAIPPKSCNRPPNLPLRAAPIPGRAGILPGYPDNDKSSKFGSCAITSRTCKRVVPFPPMVKEVTDGQNENVDNSSRLPYPEKDILSTFVNHEVCSRNSLGETSQSLTEKCRFLTYWAGLSFGTGKVLSYLAIRIGVNRTVWKRWRRHNETHGLNTRAHDWRESLESGSVKR